MIIYKVTNNKNNKIYIGQTRNSLEHRKAQHYRELTKKDNNCFHNALIKYTAKDFNWEIIANANSLTELDDLEIFYIKKFDSTNRTKGYNLKLGGNNGGLCLPETKALIGSKTKERWKNEVIKKKVTNGLQKGTESMKIKCLDLLVDFKCPICGETIKRQNFVKNKTCSITCGRIYSKENSLYDTGLKNALFINELNHLENKNIRKEKVIKWILNNKEIILKAKFNNLQFLEDLVQYVGVKDIRTVMESFDEKSSKRRFIKILQSIINENIC